MRAEIQDATPQPIVANSSTNDMLDSYRFHFNSRTHALPTMLRYWLNFPIIAVVVALLPHFAAAESDALPWKRSSEFNETSFTTTVEPKIRINVNAPLDDKGQPARATRLIVFALPNGN